MGGGAGVRTPESELLERAEWYQAQHQKLLTALNEAENRSNTFKNALKRIRDDVNLNGGKMRIIAREALK
jgi:hypothetical protein